MQQSQPEITQHPLPIHPSSKEELQASIRKELLAMEFQSERIDEALLHAQTLDKAIEFIISSMEEEDMTIENDKNDVKLFLLVRMDLKMGPGKIAAQVAHATLKAFQQMRQTTKQIQQLQFMEWMEHGQMKVILKAEDQQHVLRLVDRAKEKGINSCFIRDAGRTQIAAGSLTVAAFGPTYEKLIYEIVKSLKKL